MATALENLTAARDAICTELAAGPLKPSYSVGGQSVQWPEYRRALLDQLQAINQQIQILAGPAEFITQAMC